MNVRYAAVLLLAAVKRGDYKRIHRTADEHFDALIALVLRAFRAGRERISREDLREALTSKTKRGVIAAIDPALAAMEKIFEEAGLAELLLDIVGDSAEASGKKLRVGLRAAQPIEFAFDRTNPKAVEWAARHAGELIDGLSKRTRDQIRELVEDAFLKQFDVDELADRIAGLIGDETRAEVLARTETMRASNEGQIQLWDQAVESGLLTGDEKKEWIVTPDDRLCPICEPMDGVIVGLGDDFNVGGDRIDGPPAHPNCRCTVALNV